MTIDEKRSAIRHFCEGMEKNHVECQNCPLSEKKFCYNEKASDDIINENFKILFGEEPKCNSDIHLKGYIYDSLVYRYQLARERQLLYEISREGSIPNSARKRYVRDVTKFIEILNEVIGEHD